MPIADGFQLADFRTETSERIAIIVAAIRANHEVAIAFHDAAARPAFQAAMQAMRETGVQFVEVALPDFPYGALADVVDRKKVLCLMNLWLAAAAAGSHNHRNQVTAAHLDGQ